MRLLGECRGSMEALKRVGVDLQHEQEKMSGLGSASIAESQTSGQFTITGPLLTYSRT